MNITHKMFTQKAIHIILKTITHEIYDSSLYSECMYVNIHINIYIYIIYIYIYIHTYVLICMVHDYQVSKGTLTYYQTKPSDHLGKSW